MIESVLFQSPYSGCCKFSGWKPVRNYTAPNTQWPSAYNAPGAIICSDRSRKPTGPLKPLLAQARPSQPYPRVIAGVGGEALKPMPSAWTQKVGKPPYNLHAIAGPSSTGPYTYGIATGISTTLVDFVVGTAGQAHGGSQGLT
jgi:hypothetical protein